MQNFVFFNVINENENSASNLSTLANCPLQNYFRRQLTTTMNPERKKENTSHKCRSLQVNLREAYNQEDTTSLTNSIKISIKSK